MKLILKQLLILSFALTFISGCSSQKNIQGRIIDISFSVLEQKINKKENFILPFIKKIVLIVFYWSKQKQSFSDFKWMKTRKILMKIKSL